MRRLSGGTNPALSRHPAVTRHPPGYPAAPPGDTRQPGNQGSTIRVVPTLAQRTAGSSIGASVVTPPACWRSTPHTSVTLLSAAHSGSARPTPAAEANGPAAMRAGMLAEAAGCDVASQRASHRGFAHLSAYCDALCVRSPRSSGARCYSRLRSSGISGEPKVHR